MFHTFKSINSLYLSDFFIAFLIQTAYHPADESSSSNALVWSVLGMRCDPSYVTWTDYIVGDTVTYANISTLLNTGGHTIYNISAKVK
jgi:hypothetical protein